MCVVSAVAWAVVAWLNLRYGTRITIALLAVMIATATATAWLALPRRWVRMVAVCLGGLLLAGTAVLAWWTPMFERHVNAVVSRTPAPNGATLLVVRQGYGFAQIDPSYDAVLQTDRGPLSQQTLVWEGLEEGDAPRVARFVGTHEIEIVYAAGCTYRSAFDAKTLRPDRVYRQRAVNRCG